MENRDKSRRTGLWLVLGLLGILVCLDLAGVNPFPGSISGEGIGSGGGCGGYDASVDGGISLSVASAGVSRENLYIKSTTVWDSPIINVCWENADRGNAQGRQWVEDAITSTWEAASALDFVGWGVCNADSDGIRIKIEDSHPHAQHLGQAISGVEDGMVLNFTFNTFSPTCQNQRQYCIEVIAIHEWGHALGFSHEQNRGDSRCDDEEQGTDGDVIVGPWDLDSVMNYCNPTWSGNGVLSPGDIMGVQQTYGKGEEGLRNVFEVCSNERSQGWFDGCDDTPFSTNTFDGTCACEGDLMIHVNSGDVLCSSGTGNCRQNPRLGHPDLYEEVSQSFRDLYQRCDILRAQSHWYGSCDSPAVDDIRLFQGDCECTGDLYRHRFTGLFMCDALPRSCGGAAFSLSAQDFVRLSPETHTNTALAALYHRCSELRRTKGDWFTCESPAVDDPTLFNGLCGCGERLLRHTASGLYLCPSLPDSCGGVTFVPDMSEYDWGTTECYESPTGDDYRGEVSITRGGVNLGSVRCESWTSDAAWEFSDGIPNHGQGNHNRCRSPFPDQIESPWCLTGDPQVTWDYCDVGQPSLVCLDTQNYQCAPMPCHNGATCVDYGTRFECQCTPGFEGRRCGRAIDYCKNVDCGHGTCRNEVEEAVCQCESGWTGSSCAENIDDCGPSRCKNEGECVDGIDTYTCRCAAGFSGKRCGINIDDCLNKPCQNGGDCVDGVNAFTCNCRSGFRGTRCQVNINECKGENPCQNNGVCVDGINAYTCRCPTGFSGVQCGTNINECLGNTCQNGGACVDGVNSYRCQCNQGYTGSFCEVPPPAVTPTPATLDDPEPEDPEPEDPPLEEPQPDTPLVENQDPDSPKPGGSEAGETKPQETEPQNTSPKIPESAPIKRTAPQPTAGCAGGCAQTHGAFLPLLFLLALGRIRRRRGSSLS